MYPTASFHTLAQTLKQQSAEPPFALQIGAMDGIKFDLLHPHLAAGGWRGLLVEPAPDMFAALQKTYAHVNGLEFANCAVGENDGTLSLRRIDPAAISQGLIAEHALGLTTSSMSNSGLNSTAFLNKFPDLASHIIEFTAPAYTLHNLLERYSINVIDLLMIDTEGADWRIARQLDLSRYTPKLICLEHSNLADKERQDCVHHFLNHGYNGALCEEDAENLLFMRDLNQA